MDELSNWLDSKSDSDSVNTVLRSPLPDFNSIQDWVFEPPPSPAPTVTEESNIHIALNVPPTCTANLPTGASDLMTSLDTSSWDFAASGNPIRVEPDLGGGVELDLGKVTSSILPVEEMEKVMLGVMSAPEEGSELKEDGGEISDASAKHKGDRRLVGEDLEILNEGLVNCNVTVQYGSENVSSSCSSDSESADDDSDTDEEDNDGDCVDKNEEVELIDEDVDMEEGEIRGLEVSREAVGSDDEETAVKGPIRSKHELEILPPVPSVNVILEQHHQMTPVGTILSIVGTKVIVEGGEKHNPLNEGSILWVTESKLPLGYVDEIFGPVKNPFYVVRYNSEKELPPDIHEGILISFVTEFANHILNDKGLYEKGYDASGENDEEVSDDAEFSDDEKEAEYKRMQRMSKRGKDNANSKNVNYVSTKRVNGKGGSWKSFPSAVSSLKVNSSQQEKLAVNPASASCQLQLPTQMVSGSCSLAHVAQPMDPFKGPRQDMESSGRWPNAVPIQHPVLHPFNGTLMGGVHFPQQPDYQFYGYLQNHQQYPTHTGFSAQLPFPQQFGPNQGGTTPLPQVNFPMGMTSSLWPAAQLPANLNQAPFITGLSGGGQLPSFQGNLLAAQQFNPGNASVRGRKPFRRGRGGHFSGRQGLQ